MCGIDHHHRPADGTVLVDGSTELAFGDELQPGVDGEFERHAGSGRLAQTRGEHVLLRILLHDERARRAGHELVVGQLEAADARVLGVHEPEQRRRQLAIRIVATALVQEADAGQLHRRNALRLCRRRTLADIDEVLLALQALLDCRELIVVAARELLADALGEVGRVLEFSGHDLQRTRAATPASIDNEAVLLQRGDAVGFLRRERAEHCRTPTAAVEALDERAPLLAIAAVERVAQRRRERVGILHIARHGVDDVAVHAVGQQAPVPIEDGPATRVDLDGLALLTLGAQHEGIVLKHLQVNQARDDAERPEHDEGADEGEPGPHVPAPVGRRRCVDVVIGALRVAHHARVVQCGGARVQARQQIGDVPAGAPHRVATTALVGGGVTVTRSITVDVSPVGAFMCSCRVAIASTRAGPARNSCSSTRWRYTARR